MTIARRPPSNAVPTRRCVAPHAIACSRSPLIPALTIRASGWFLRISSATASRAKAGIGSAPSGATAITPPSRRPAGFGDLVGQPRHGIGGRTAPTLSGLLLVQRHLDEAAQRAPGADGGVRQPGDKPGPVHRVHDVGVPRDRASLVGLQPSDEMPGKGKIGAFGGLRTSLLVAVLPDLGEAESGQQPHIGGGKGLRHRDERDLTLVLPAAAHAAAIRSRTAAIPSANSARRCSG